MRFLSPEVNGKTYLNEKARLDFELLITEISSSLVHVPPDEVDAVINASLQKILDFFQIDRAVLWQREAPDSNRFVITHAKIRPGHGPQVMPNLTTDSFPWMTAQYLAGRETKYSRIDDLPEEAAVDKETLRRFALKYSAMAVPLFDGDKVYGIFTLGITKEMIWPDELAPRLRVVAHVFSSALIRSKTEQKLQKTLNDLEKAKSQLERENVYLRQEMHVLYSPTEIVYQGHAMGEVLAKAEQVAATNSSVLLMGETGTGKEMIASLIHEKSQRCGRTMIRVNCGAIPAALVESEMFGREKGAYTGALSRQIGRFELAHESTIFLDEITDLPLEVQVKLLRVLQEKEIERLGNPKPIHINVRVIAATNQSLEKAVQEGKFREDLYYRLNVFPIDVPLLRDRREDIPLLVWSFVDMFSAEFGKKVESISKSSMEALLEYSWPGNVRELRNTIERAMIVLNSTNLHIDLPKPIASTAVPENLTLKEIEINHIRKVLEAVGWKIRGRSGAAEILGMKPTTLETRMVKLGIVRPMNKTQSSNPQ
jgi:formate hydrogenlyase transcriptional activator